MERKFTRVDANSSKSENEIRVMSWNILARALCNPEENPNEICKAPKSAYDWPSFRFYRTLEEMIRFECDIMCVQEVDVYEEIKPYLHSLGLAL